MFIFVGRLDENAGNSLTNAGKSFIKYRGACVRWHGAWLILKGVMSTPQGSNGDEELHPEAAAKKMPMIKHSCIALVAPEISICAADMVLICQ